MADVKTYQIVINGLTESISAVDSLNKQLDVLDKKIAALQGKAVNVSVNGGDTSLSSGGGGVSRTSELSDEDKLLKQIENTQSKINQADMADYKVLLDKKNELKELVKEQKSMTAEARLSDNAYANTMLGMKQHLADIKAVMQTVDLNDSDTFEKLTKDANELNSKLLEIEKSYGQFGRQVGHYEIVAEGFKGLKIDIGGISEEFENARQAYMTLKREMQTLATKKDLGIITDEETERLKSLIPTVKQLESSIADAGKPMDALMDNMQSFVALAQAGKGIAAFFGIEGTEIDETIKNLVALQNAMQGLQTIQKQLQTGEGLGKYFSKGNTAIDNFTKKLFGLKKATTEVTTASKAQAAATSTVATASKGATTAEVAQTTATAGLTVGMKAATVAARLLSTALKAIGIGIVMEGISWAIEGIKSLVSWLTAADEKEKQMIENQKKIQEAGAEAFAKANAEVKAYQQRINSFNGTQEQEKKLVEELNEQFGTALGSYQSLAEWKQVLIEKGEAYIETLKKEAEAQALLEIYKEAYKEYLAELDKIKSGEYDSMWSTHAQDMMRRAEKERNAINNLNSAMDAYLAKLQETESYTQTHQVFDYAPSVSGSTSGSTSGRYGGVGKTAKDIENDIINQRIKVMREGLVKTISQYTIERNRRIEEVRKNGRRVGEQEELINKEYQNKVLSARISYHQKLLAEEQSFLNAESSLQKSNQDKAISWQSKAYDRRLQLAIDHLFSLPQIWGASLKKIDDELEKYSEITEDDQRALLNDLANLNEKYLADEIGLLSAGWQKVQKVTEEGADDMYMTVQKAAEDEIIFEQTLTERLDVAINRRLGTREKYYQEILRLQKENAKKQLEIQKSNIDASLEADLKAEEKRFEQLAGLYSRSVFRLTDDGSRAETATQNPIQKALEEYKKGMETLEFDGMTKQQIGEDLWSVKEEVEEFINELESGYKEGLISFEEYNNTMQSTLLKTLVTAKNNYEDFLGEYNQMSRANQNANLSELNRYQGEYYESFAKFLDDLAGAEQTHVNTVTTLQNEARENERQAELQHQQAIQTSTNEYFSNIVNEYDRGYSAIERLIDTYQTSNRISNEYGFINLKKLRENLNMASGIINDRLIALNEKREQLLNKKQLNEITQEDYDTQIENIDALAYNLNDALEKINEKARDGVQNLVNVINNYVQVLGNSIQTIMDANNEYQDYLFDKQQEDLDKQNEILEDKLSEQEDILQKHKSAVDSIEDELATARGDRRQHLIDQLNEEIAAQRRAQAEKEQIEKEEEALKKKQDELDKQRKKAEYNRNLQSILVSGAMTISNAFATQPFVPVGLAMGALATTLTAYQYAMAKKAKPYATGGVIEGKSHKDGGVPVLGGRVSVEGGEFITNKRTTAKNTPLLEYINSKKKRIDLADMVEFFNDKPRATIKNIRSKFADGGTLPSSIDVREQLRDVIVYQDSRPVVVSVVDVINKGNDVRRVQALAGL